MKSRKFTHFLSIILFVWCVLYRSNTFGNALLINHITDVNGLPQNSIKAMVKDKLGYLWIATEHGLARYDGNRIKVFIDTSLQSNRILTIIPSGEDHVFYAINEHHEVLKIKNGRIKKMGVEIMINDRFQYSLKHKSVTSVIQYFINAKGHLCYIGISNKGKYTVLDDSKLNTPLTLSNHHNTFGMNGDVYTIDNQFNITKFDAKNPPLNDLEENTIQFPKVSDLSKNVIFVFNRKVFDIHQEKGKFIITELINHLPENITVSNIHYDYQNSTLFIGTATNGLFIYKINSGIVIPKTSINKSYAAQAKLQDNLVLAFGEIIGLDTLINITKRTSSINPYAILKDHFNHIYYPVNASGIYRITNINSSEKGRKIFEQNEASCIYEDPANRLWICNKKNGLIIYDNNHPEKKPLIKSFPKLNKMHGNIAYSRNTKTFYLINANKLYQLNDRLEFIDSLTLNKKLKVKNIYVSNTDIIWLSTYGSGLYCINNKVLYQLPTDKNEFLLISHCVFQDKQSDYWITTNKGLFRIRSGLVENHLFSGHPEKIKYIYYSTYDGLNTNEFNGSCFPCAIESSNNRFSLPSIAGLIWIQPDKMKDPPLISDILIDEIIVDNKLLNPESPVKLDNNIFRLTLKLSLAYWGNPDNIELAYKLDGIDKYWIPLNTDYSINYNNLPGGKYVLKVQLKDNLHPDKILVKNIPIDIPLSYYQKWWFYVLCFVGFIAIIIIYSNARNKKIKLENTKLEKQIAERTIELVKQNKIIENNLQLLKKKQEVLNLSISIKDRAMSVFSHNIVGPLKFITILTDNMAGSNKTIDEKNLKTIDQTSKSLLQHSLDLLTWVKTQDETFKIQKEMIHLNEFVLQKIQLFNHMAESNGIRFDIKVDDSIAFVSDKQLLNIIFYNLVENAIKYSTNGTITISAQIEGDMFQLIVKDTGKGMTPLQVSKLNDYALDNNRTRYIQDDQKGFGIGWFIIADCMSLLAASYKIESQIDKGTTVTLNFPV